MSLDSPSIQSQFRHSLLHARDWQHRPQLDVVCEWWRGSGNDFQPVNTTDRPSHTYATAGRGVLALIGIGGAGKTAIAERFLRVLSGGLAEDSDIPNDSTLPVPDSVFVFSFYDAPNSQAFFEALQMWLENTPRFQTVLSLNRMLFLLQWTSRLMVVVASWRWRPS